MLYSIVLFLHIIGAILMFIALGTTLAAMISMIHAKRVETMQAWASLAVKMDSAMPFCIILIIMPGLYLVVTTWGWGQAWANFSLVLLLGMTVMGVTVNVRKLRGILNTANVEAVGAGVPSENLMNEAKDRTLWNSISVMVMLSVGIVFLMTVKAGVAGSIATIAVSVMAGFIVSAFLLGRAAKAVPSSSNGTAL